MATAGNGKREKNRPKRIVELAKGRTSEKAAVDNLSTKRWRRNVSLLLQTT